MDELPPSFVCAICRRVIEPDRWDWRKNHKPPVCHPCGTVTTYRGYQVNAMRRQSGMTRGDHREIQRLLVLSDALIRETYRGKFAF